MAVAAQPASAGAQYALYVISNGTTAQLLQANPTNSGAARPVAFFSLAGANPDGVAHIDWPAPGVIGFEERWEYAAIGNVPNLAARLCGSAHAGEIILDAQTEHDIVAIADTEFDGALTLRGFQQPVPAFRLKSLRD